MSKINYNLKKIRAIAFDVDGVLSPSTVPMSPDGVPVRMANLKDGYAMVLAVRAGLHLAIISGAVTDAVRNRFANIGVQNIYLGNFEKLPVLEQWMNELGLNANEVAYVGDDLPDIPCLRRVGLAVAPADAAVEVRQCAHYISSANGGYGVGRELIEEIMKAQGIWPSTSASTGV